MYWTDYTEDVVYRANLTTGQDRETVVTEHLPEPGECVCVSVCVCTYSY